MVTVPAFLLRRLYVKKSLRNTENGFEFELRTRLGSGSAFTLQPLTVDGVELPNKREKRRPLARCQKNALSRWR